MDKWVRVGRDRRGIGNLPDGMCIGGRQQNGSESEALTMCVAGYRVSGAVGCMSLGISHFLHLFRDARALFVEGGERRISLLQQVAGDLCR